MLIHFHPAQIHDVFQIHNVFSSVQSDSSCQTESPPLVCSDDGDDGLDRLLDSERRSLWRLLVLAARPAETQKKKAVIRHGTVHAVFLALDGQYRCDAFKARGRRRRECHSLAAWGWAGKRKQGGLPGHLIIYYII